ncbi:MAG TPA: response regulator transcription factor [Kofleriaceae bacterium]|nr:response regulator transcription factor [Kofleriaceae bacterium]
MIDDEPDLARLLVFNLEEMGFATEAVVNGSDGLAAAARLHPEVIVLDLMLPDLPGTEVCRRLRADAGLADTAVLMLTARSDDLDRVEGFEVGADDYVTKPYNVQEVCLRVRALARRVAELRRARSPAADDGAELRRWRGLEVDLRRHRVRVDGTELSLRPLEFRLLALFLGDRRVLSRDDILDEVWGADAVVSPRTIDVHVRRLRERLGRYGMAIETVHGFGYRLADE